MGAVHLERAAGGVAQRHLAPVQQLGSYAIRRRHRRCAEIAGAVRVATVARAFAVDADDQRRLAVGFHKLHVSDGRARIEVGRVVGEAALAGSEIDFTDDLIGAAFKINNPNATASCGCGTSFSV